MQPDLLHWARRGLAILLASACLAGCSTAGSRADRASQHLADLTDSSSTRKVVFIGPGPAGRQVVCLFRPSPVTTSEDGAGRSRELKKVEAALLGQGLYDLCMAYRAGHLAPEQYAGALQDYASLVVLLAGYRALAAEAAADCISPESQYVSSLIGANLAMQGLCGSPGFRARLEKFENVAASTDLSIWCTDRDRRAAGSMICAR